MALDSALLAMSRACRLGMLSRERETRERFAHDESDAPPCVPEAVVWPGSAQEVAGVLRAASEHGCAITPRAAGTGRAGGAVPSPGGVLMVLERFDQILGIEPQNSRAIVQPGVVTGQLHQAAESEGFFYGPDPNSWKTCQLGGNIACNAGGPRAFKYGVTGNWVLGMQVALASGELLTFGKGTTKGVCGYDLTSLIVGSEGTLGVVTEATLRLRPAPPHVGTLAVFLEQEEALGAVIGAALAQHIEPRCVEFLDGLALDILRAHSEFAIPSTARCMLLIEVDGDESSVARQIEEAGNRMMGAGALHIEHAADPKEQEALWAPRRNMSRLMREQCRHKLSEDIVVPRSRIGALLSQCRRDAETLDIRIATYGHAGDGNLHVNFLWDSPDEKRRIDQAIEKLFERTIALGGTITGEHGVGLTKAPYLHLEQPPALIDLQKRIKATLDPKGILNPGKVFQRSHGPC